MPRSAKKRLRVMFAGAGCLIAALMGMYAGLPEDAAAPAEAAPASVGPPRAESAALRTGTTSQPMPHAPPARTGELSPGLLPPPTYHPRAPKEWQGMLVNTSLQAECGTASHCGLAMACLSGRCGPCMLDGDCAAGERCVLDHCVKAGNVACRSRADCGGEALCVLTGYSPDPRGNEEMRANCLSTTGGVPQDESAVARPTLPPGRPPPIQPRALLDSIHARASEEGNRGDIR